jgi:cardiolipin synthase
MPLGEDGLCVKVFAWHMEVRERGRLPFMDNAVAAYADPPGFRAEAAGHVLDFVPAGPERLDLLLKVIADARESLKVAFYIFAEDDSGRRVRDALADAARRGVRVTLIVDDFGTSALRPFFAAVEEAGGKFRNFLPRLSRRYLIRNHQKIVIADQKLAIMGGFNVADDYFKPTGEGGWHDLAVMIEGPVVEQAYRWFLTLEALVSGRAPQFRAVLKAVKKWKGGTGPVQLLIGGPTRGLSSWARVISADLLHGRQLDMVMAYFAPPRRLRRRMRKIAAKGETRLVLAGKSDNGATIGAARLLYRSLLRSGAKIWEFAPDKLHMKLIVLDDAVYLGSANFDMRSLYLNLEIVLRIEDRALADRLRAFVTDHLPASQAITREVHRQQAGWFNRMRWTVSWFLVSVLDYTVSRRLNLGL